MRFLIALFCFIWVPTVLLSTETESVFKKLEKELDSVIIKDINNKKLIFSKDENQPLRPASLTKIMTSILAIESSKMDSIVKITSEMTKVEPTVSKFKVGETFYLKDLVHAALIKSSNDAANAIAIYLGNGNKQTFVNMMNAKAKKIGMKKTNFTNPCGFDIGEHRSTAKDLLALTEYAIKSTTFNSIVKLDKYTFKSLNTNKTYVVRSSNKLLKNQPYIVGVKTGYTNKAGACYIARAKKGNKDIVMVMLNAHNRWVNAKQTLDSIIN